MRRGDNRLVEFQMEHSKTKGNTAEKCLNKYVKSLVGTKNTGTNNFTYTRSTSEH